MFTLMIEGIISFNAPDYLSNVGDGPERKEKRS